MTTPDGPLRRHYRRNLAAAVARQALALAEGTWVGPEYNVAQSLLRDAQALAAGTPNDTQSSAVTPSDAGHSDDSGAHSA